MTRIARLFGVLFLVGTTTALVAQEKPKFDAGKLPGVYKLTGGMLDGEKAKEAEGDVTFTKDKISLTDGEMKFEFAYKVTTVESPAAIDMEILEPEAFKGAKALGIIEFTKDGIALAYHPMGGERPTNFAAKKGTGEFAFQLEKAKEKKKGKK